MKTKLITSAMLAAAMAVMSAPALAEWVRVDSADACDVYVDLSTIRRKGNMVKMWSMDNCKAPQVKLWGAYLSVKHQSMYDCAEEQIRELAATAYSAEMGLGNAVVSQGERKWQPVYPGSIGETKWKVACGKLK